MINFLNRISKIEKFKIQICLKISILRTKIPYLLLPILNTPNIHDPKISKIQNLDRKFSKWNSNSTIQILLLHIHIHSKFEQIRAILKALIYTNDIYAYICGKSLSYEVKKNIQQRLSPDPRKRHSFVLPLIHKHLPPCTYTPRRSPFLSRDICFELVREGKERENALSDRLPVEKSSQVSAERFCKTSPRTTPPRRDHETRNRGSNINFPNFAYDPSSLEYSCCSIVSNASVIFNFSVFFLPSSLPSSVFLNVSGKANFSSELRCSFERFNTVSFTMRQIMSRIGDCTAVSSSSITFLFVTYFIVYALSRVPDSSLRILLMFLFVHLCSERLTDNFTIPSPSCIYFLTLLTKYDSLLTNAI